MKLTIELVPETSWYNNLRSMMPQDTWDTLRKKVYQDYNNRCGICGNRGVLHCHEMWEYDDKKHTQTLKGLIALCRLCHFVKHIGLAAIRSDNFETVVRHFMNVNQCDRKTFEKHRNDALILWQKRSAHTWNIHIGTYNVI